MALGKLNKDFTDALREIMYTSARLTDPYERVKIMQWVRKLSQVDDKKLEMVRIRNEYVHYLRIMLTCREKVLFMVPFKRNPPDGELEPLTEVLANHQVEQCPDLPKAGPIRPVLFHKTSDGRAFMTVKRCPEGGVFCYLAVTPDPMIK